MKNYLVVTALGVMSTENYQKIATHVMEANCNIVEGRMNQIGNEFTMLLLISGSWNAIAKIENILPRIERELNLKLLYKRTDIPGKSNTLMPYVIDLVCPDKKDVVMEISRFFEKNDIPIQELHTTSYEASFTGTAMLALHLTINIPTDMSIASLRGDFMDFCDRLNLDAAMEPVK